MVYYQWIAVASIPVIWLGWKILQKRKGMDLPGPKPLPLVGNLHQVDTAQLHVNLHTWAREYGDVYQLNLAGVPVVVVTGTQAIYEVLVKKSKAFSGRPHSYTIDLLTFDGHDVAFTNDSPIRHFQKKLMSQAIRAYGTAGLQRVEEITVAVAKKCMDDIQVRIDDGNGLFDIHDEIEDLTLTTINIMTFGREFSSLREMEEVRELVRLMVSIGHDAFAVQGFLLGAFPMFRLFNPPIYRKVQMFRGKLQVIYKKWLEIEGNAEHHEPSLFTKLLDAKEAEGNKVELNDFHIMWSVFDMFSAGVNTTSTTMTWLCNILVHYPNVQRQVHDEIDDIVSDGHIVLELRQRMPYTQAVILEVLRYTSILPMLLPHRAIEDTEIQGHRILQDTQVWVNAWGQHHDDRIWSDPFTFNPNRFLDSNGSLVLADHPNRVNLVPFGAGSRVCSGETFALSRLFLILVMLLTRFEVLPATTLADQPPCDSRQMTLGVVLAPPPHSVRLQRRQ